VADHWIAGLIPPLNLPARRPRLQPSDRIRPRKESISPCVSSLIVVNSGITAK